MILPTFTFNNVEAHNSIGLQQKRTIKTIKEEVDPNIKWSFQWPKFDFDANRDEDHPYFGAGYLNNCEWRLIRHLKDDTFDVGIKSNYAMVPVVNEGTYSRDERDLYSEVPYFNLNNHIEFDYNNKWFYSQKTDEGNKNEEWKVHHTNINDTEFHKISTLVVGSDIYNEGWKSREHFWRMIMNPVFMPIQKNISIDMNDIVELKMLKEIIVKFETNQPLKLMFPDNSDGKQPAPRVHPVISYKYLNLFIVPTMVDQWKGNSKIAELYLENEDYNSRDHFTTDLQFPNSKMYSSSSTKHEPLDIYWDKSDTSEHRVPEISYARYIGDMKISSSTYYNYASKQMNVGFGENGINGELIPFGFSGFFKREFNMNFNPSFRDMNIGFSTNIESPVLDSSQGLVKLNLNANNNPLNEKPKKYFDLDDIKLIRERKFNLQGLKNLLKE